MPSPLCHWTMHVVQPDYDALPDSLPLEHGTLDSSDPETYEQWPEGWKMVSYPERLRNALERNDFSNIPVDRLPAAIPETLRVAERYPGDLARESLGFAIMSRNLELLLELLKSNHTAATRDIDVFHLATSYLDGSKTCCDILNTICGHVSVRRHYTNNLGHTVLDNLMIAIVKGHTSCAPDKVDEAFKRYDRFAGEEVDICGRWDADSDCVRELLARGIHRIPFKWKHKFCHTSIQTICHSIITIWRAGYQPDINTCSGLFVRRCSQPHCGLKMQMTPLHTLVLVALQLASHGCEEEDLFGVVAVLLCLLKYGANPSLQSTLSIRSLVGGKDPNNDEEELDHCEHESVDPLQLARRTYSLRKAEWTEKVHLGWKTFCEVLQYSQRIWARRDSQRALGSEDEEEEGVDAEGVREGEGAVSRICSMCLYDPRTNYLGKDGRLGLLWSAMNAELVTYRRLQVGHPWMSHRINLEGMLESLQKNCAPDMLLVREHMMKPSCSCGSFMKACYDDCISPEDACASYFSNMEDWSRTTFLSRRDEE
jgi:hypothetical protein